jgi:hypothetical protein
MTRSWLCGNPLGTELSPIWHAGWTCWLPMKIEGMNRQKRRFVIGLESTQQAQGQGHRRPQGQLRHFLQMLMQQDHRHGQIAADVVGEI